MDRNYYSKRIVELLSELKINNFDDLEHYFRNLEDFVLMQKSTILDMAYLQQDAYDKVDVSVPIERQKAMLDLISSITDKEFVFENKENARKTFIKLTSLFKNLN
jgi:V/A-type H+-transporting ATPase subunit A